MSQKLCLIAYFHKIKNKAMVYLQYKYWKCTFKVFNFLIKGALATRYIKKSKVWFFFVQSIMKVKQWNNNSLFASKKVKFCQITLRNLDN